MRLQKSFVILFSFVFSATGCKKEKASGNCFSNEPTHRTITNKKATVRLTATYLYPVYLVEDGALDTKLIPCDFPVEQGFYQDGLQVTISGQVKNPVQFPGAPCCFENFVITTISR